MPRKFDPGNYDLSGGIIVSDYTLGGSSLTPGVEMGIDIEPPMQSQLSILFRLPLLLPLLVANALLSLAAVLLVIVGWFSALVLGRLPDSLQQTLTGILRFSVNVQAYSYLLTGTYPRFELSQRDDSEVFLSIRHDQLNRLAVLFRVILAIPAVIFISFLQYGVYIYVIIMWFAGVATGRCPRNLHKAVAINLRTIIRANAYIFLLTPDQPFAKWLGDGVTDSETPSLEPSRTTDFILTRSARTTVAVSLVVGIVVDIVTRR